MARPAWLLLACVAWVMSPAVPLRAQEDDFVVVDQGEVVEVEDTSPPADAVPGADRVELRGEPRSLADALDDAPGVRIIRTGGEGAAWQLGIQGLQGRRVATYLGPVRLDDPVTGTLDLSEIPAAALSEASLTRGASSSSEGALGGVLRLRMAPPVLPVLRGSWGISSENTATMDVAAGAPASWGKAVWGVTALARGSSTSGKFQYVPVGGPVDAPVDLPVRTRANNDRHRLGFTVLAAGEVLEGPSAAGVLDVAVLQGGMPGYSLTPVTTTRLEQTRVAAGVQLGWALRPWLQPALESSARLNAWRFEDRRPGGPRGALWSGTFSTTASTALRLAPSLWVTSAVLGQADVARTTLAAGAYDALRPLVDGNATVRAEPWDGRVRTLATVHAVGWMGGSRTGEAFTAVAPRAELLPEVRLEVAPVDGLVLHTSVARAWRIPSMEEMYRPTASILAGNPDLKPEDGVEVDASARARLGLLSGVLALYAARMNNMIAYVNVNAFDLRPQNVSAVWRAGGEVSGRLDLGTWGSLGAGVDVNHSYIEATRAALPSVPLLDLRANSLLGPPAARGVVEVSVRTGAAGNLNGELPVRPATRLDVGMVLRPFPGQPVELRALVRNLADDRRQTDLWGVPQPGREASVTLAVDPGAAVGGGA